MFEIGMAPAEKKMHDNFLIMHFHAQKRIRNARDAKPGAEVQPRQGLGHA